MAEEADKQPPLLVFVVVEKKQQQLQQERAVKFVSFWALFNAIIFALAFAIDYTFRALCHHHRPAEVEEDDALEAGVVIWCAVVQAAAAALALLLACHRRKIRLALAYAALAAAVVSHCTFASVIGVLLAHDPGHLLLRICGTLANFVFAGGDVVCFLALLRGGE